MSNWKALNEKAGQFYGYPQCCIDAFCAQSPEKMKHSKPTLADQQRFQAAHVNGVWTGFIPCLKHAKEILAGHTTLSELISNRDPKAGPFMVKKPEMPTIKKPIDTQTMTAQEAAEDLVHEYIIIIDTASTSLIGPDDGPEIEQIAIECAIKCAKNTRNHLDGASNDDVKFWSEVVQALEMKLP